MNASRADLILTGLVCLLLALFRAAAADSSGPQPPVAASASLSFKPAASGEFTFDTGILRGKLRAGGKSLGLSSVVHVPTGRRLDRSNGLFSHYRVFSKGVRYGAGAWDWPSTARLLDDGAVEVNWIATTNRPFVMKAVYRWMQPMLLELQTLVEPQVDLRGFEVFLASYFDEAFTNAFAVVNETAPPSGKPVLLAARQSLGDWLMFPRSAEVVPLIQDGRWKLEPNPVNWTIMPATEWPMGVRRDPKSGLTAILAAADGFAVAMPYQTEGHYSTYLALFGRDLKADGTHQARALLTMGLVPEETQILQSYGYTTK